MTTLFSQAIKILSTYNIVKEDSIIVNYFKIILLITGVLTGENKIFFIKNYGKSYMVVIDN